MSKIQQSVGNKNWILRAGALHIFLLPYMLLGKQLMEVVLIHVLLKVVHTHQQLFVGSLVARRTREVLSITSLTASQF